MRRSSRHRGFALADFLAGSMILSGTMALFVALTQSKFRTLEAAELRSRAQAALEVELDRVRLQGPGGVPAGEADREGFRVARSFSPEGRLPVGQGQVALRALRVDGAAAHQMFEARVTVRWQERPGDARSWMRISASTVVLLAGEGPR